jgi:hypothetical protein
MITMVNTDLLVGVDVLLWATWCFVVFTWFRTQKFWSLAAVIMLHIAASLLTYGILYPWHGVTL